MDVEKLIHCLQCCARVDAHNVGCDDCGLEYCGPECQQLCGTAATALSTLKAENKKLRAELEKVMRERDAAQSLLAERIGVRGAEPITTAFGLPIDRLRELAQADREGRCVVLPCKVRDTLYDIYEAMGNGTGEIRELKVTDIHIHLDKRSKEWLIVGGYYFSLSDFGKTVFLTRAEAEDALRREQDKKGGSLE